MPHVVYSGLKVKACVIYDKDARRYECAEAVGIEHVKADSVFAMVLLSESVSRDLYQTSGFRSLWFEGTLLCEIKDECELDVTHFEMQFRAAGAVIIEHNGIRCIRLSLDNTSQCNWTYLDGSHSYGPEPRRKRKES